MSLNQYIPISTYLAGEIGTAAGSSPAYSNNNGILLAAENACDSGCQTGCAGSCTSSCATGCATGCSGTCSGGCRGGCSGTCSGGCKGGCQSTCSGTCSSTCTGNCAKTCSGGCETYCANACQTFCQKEQVFSKNSGKNNPGGSIFTWSTTIKEGEFIEIKASDWNTLASYIEKASSYCSSSGKVSVSRVTSNDLITAAAFNSINSGLSAINSGVGTKTAGIDLIKADEINALASKYNAAKILSTLPSTNGSTSGKCCQLGEACMTKASGRPSLQPCDQTPPCISSQY